MAEREVAVEEAEGEKVGEEEEEGEAEGEKVGEAEGSWLQGTQEWK